jgi:hypothetical protein
VFSRGAASARPHRLFLLTGALLVLLAACCPLTRSNLNGWNLGETVMLLPAAGLRAGNV